jgi:hypothetical protein
MVPNAGESIPLEKGCQWEKSVIWFVLFIWLNQTYRVNRMNQINQIDQTN